MKGFLIFNGVIVAGDRKSKLLISYQQKKLDLLNKAVIPKFKRKRNKTAESSTER